MVRQAGSTRAGHQAGREYEGRSSGRQGVRGQVVRQVSGSVDRRYGGGGGGGADVDNDHCQLACQQVQYYGTIYYQLVIV